ncbi:hypothetical protein LUX02_17785 [Streptomyces somaliensis]|nr:hypothetical protein [Streptomyces somaliensis]
MPPLRRAERSAAGPEQAGRLVGGLQVVVEEPPPGVVDQARIAVGGLPGEGADQAVEGVAAGDALEQEPRVEQVLQEGLGGGRGEPGEGGGRVPVEVGTGVDAQQPEQLPVAGRQGGVRRVERGADAAVLDGQLVEAQGLLAEPFGQVGEAPVGPVGEPGGGDAQGERQAAAEGDQFGGGLPLGRDPPGAQHPAQERQCVGGGEQRQRKRHCTV